MSQTQAVAGINSLDSKSLESCNITKGAGDRENNKRKSVASTVTHKSDLSEFPSLFGSGSVKRIFRFRLGGVGSYPAAAASPKYSFPCIFLFSTDHEVLESSIHLDVLDHFFLEHLLVPATLRRAGC